MIWGGVDHIRNSNNVIHGFINVVLGYRAPKPPEEVETKSGAMRALPQLYMIKSSKTSELQASGELPGLAMLFAHIDEGKVTLCLTPQEGDNGRAMFGTLFGSALCMSSLG